MRTPRAWYLYDDVLDLAKRNEVIVYAIGLVTKDQPATRGWNEAEFVLKTLTRDTGGRAFFVADPAQLPAIYIQISEELASQYLGWLHVQERQERRDVAPDHHAGAQGRRDGPHPLGYFRADGAQVTGGGGRCLIIGAGPGDASLMTVRGVRLLADADVVVYDKATEAALRWARPDAERIAVGAPAERAVAQDAISMLIAEKARDGHTVARLKWGDPFLFDSGAKEAMFLHEQGVAFEIVPGVPAALGARRMRASPHPSRRRRRLVLIRGHEGTNRSRFPTWTGARSPPSTAPSCAGRTPDSRAGAARARRSRTLARRCGRAHLSRHTALAANRRRHDRRIAGTDVRVVTPLTGTRLVVIGEWSDCGSTCAGSISAPLFGKRIVVTRSLDRARELGDALENLGAEAIVAPTFRLAPPEDPEAVDRVAASLDRYDWVVFESAVRPPGFLVASAAGPARLRAFGRASICAVGPSTADQLRRARTQGRRRHPGTPRGKRRRTRWRPRA